jgi:hypothetical protein
MNTNEIVEIHDGVFRVILDFPDQDQLVLRLIDKNTPLVMLCEFRCGNYTWQQFEISGVENLQGSTRELKGDIIISTESFIENHSNMKWKWAIQLQQIPPDYFDFSKIQGSERYRILGQCGFRFILESQPRGGDYCELISPLKNLLESEIQHGTA